jgi:hypothetical protein
MGLLYDSDSDNKVHSLQHNKCSINGSYMLTKLLKKNLKSCYKQWTLVITFGKMKPPQWGVRVCIFVIDIVQQYEQEQ